MKELTQGNILKNFILYSIPIILSGLLSQAFNTVDTVIVGKCLGEHGLAAVGSTSSFIEIISAIIWGLGTGIAIYIAVLFGGKEFNKLTNSIKVNLIAISTLAVLISAVVIAMHGFFFSLLKIKEDIYKDAFTYFAIYMSGFVFLAFNWCCVYIFNAVGNPSFPLKMSVLSFVGNIFADILLVYYLDMGVAGAAIASVGVAAFVSVLYIFQLRKNFKEIDCGGQKMYFNRREITKAWKLGIPCMFQQVLLYLSSVGVQPLVNNMGSAAIAGYVISMRIYSIISTIFQNSSKCLGNYCAQCMGAKKFNMISKGLKTAVIQALTLTVPLIIICMAFPRSIAGIFLNDSYSSGADYAVQYIKVCFPFLIFCIGDNMFHNFYRGVMKINTIVFSTGMYTAAKIITAYIAAPFIGIMGIYLAIVIAWLTEIIILVTNYKSGRWKSAEHKKTEEVF